ncbi:thermonuclease family protein [Xanthobacteraceae bacterium A53D]
MRLRPRSLPDTLIAFGLLAGLFVLAHHLSDRWGGAEDVAGPAFAVDGDTLTVLGTRVRLAGIDAPERDQTCGPKGRLWPCGQAAHRALETALAGGMARCEGQAHDVYGRLVAICRVGETDVAEDLVRAGLAVSTGRYRPAEQTARAAGTGLWSGPFAHPADWRAEQAR